ncbi:hypothetical protein QF026_008608 [Streptomyces aurantiacus]|nr:hypothetical protein [Streptomyces aurantiacus]
MKRALVTGFAAALLAGSGLVAGAGAAIAGPAATCQTWNDARTFGGKCSSGTYYAQATCTNGSKVRGATASNGSWSYAYCASVGSNYKANSGRIKQL